MQQSADLLMDPAPANPPTMLWFEAIARRLCVTATYNGTEATLAPHNLYRRGEQLYVAAVAVARRGLPVTERKVGVFALAGLREGALTDETFALDPGYDPADPRWAETSLFAVEP